MAVTNCKLIADACSMSLDWEYNRSYKLKYRVDMDSPGGPITALMGARGSGNDDPLPVEGQFYEALGDVDFYAFASDFSFTRVDPKRWDIGVTYKTLPPGKQEGDFNVDPLLRPVKYRKGRLVGTQRVSKDKDGKPIANSAGQELSETFEDEFSYPLLIATRNVATLDELFENAAEWEGVVSSNTYRDFSARKWWVQSIEASDLITEKDTEYYQETWTLALNKETWDMQALDRGWKVLNNENKLVDATDDEGNPVNEPVNLIAGKKATTLVPPTVPVQGTHYDILTFRWRGEKSFSNIPV